MNMHSHRLGMIAFMTSNGPLWEATRDNKTVLISVYSSDIARDQMQRWIAWRGLVHPNVAELVEISCQSDGRVSLSQRRYTGRTLQALLDSGQQLNDNQRRRIVADVRAGVCALHDRGIIHTDIAPSNIVVSADFHATLIDIAIPAQAGEGTPGFSLSATKDQRSDDAAIEAIACALNTDPHGLNPTRVEQRPLQQTADSRCENPPQMNDAVTWRKEPLLDKQSRGLPATQARRRGALAGIIIVLLSVIYGMTRPATLSNAPLSTGGIRAQSVPSSGGIERSRHPDATQSAPLSENRQSGETQEETEPADPMTRMDLGQGIQPFGRDQVASIDDFAIDGCPDISQANDIVSTFMRARDQAMMDRNIADLDNFMEGDALRAEAEKIATLRRFDAFVKHLESESHVVNQPSCSDTELTIEATVTQSDYQRCDGAKCVTLPASTSQDVVMTFMRLTGRVSRTAQQAP